MADPWWRIDKHIDEGLEWTNEQIDRHLPPVVREAVDFVVPDDTLDAAITALTLPIGGGLGGKMLTKGAAKLAGKLPGQVGTKAASAVASTGAQRAVGGVVRTNVARTGREALTGGTGGDAEIPMAEADPFAQYTALPAPPETPAAGGGGAGGEGREHPSGTVAPAQRGGGDSPPPRQQDVAYNAAAEAATLTTAADAIIGQLETDIEALRGEAMGRYGVSQERLAELDRMEAEGFADYDARLAELPKGSPAWVLTSAGRGHFGRSIRQLRMEIMGEDDRYATQVYLAGMGLAGQAASQAAQMRQQAALMAAGWSRDSAAAAAAAQAAGARDDLAWQRQLFMSDLEHQQGQEDIILRAEVEDGGGQGRSAASAAWGDWAHNNMPQGVPISSSSALQAAVEHLVDTGKTDQLHDAAQQNADTLQDMAINGLIDPAVAEQLAQGVNDWVLITTRGYNQQLPAWQAAA